jgi:hypothetical protein
MFAQLQRTAGNRLVTRLINDGSLTKLGICVQRQIIYNGRQITAGEAKRIIKGRTTLTESMSEALDRVEKDPSQTITGTDEATLTFSTKQAVRAASNLTDQEWDVIDKYQGGTYIPLNEALRGNDLIKKAEFRDFTTLLISALKKVPKTRQGSITKRTLSFATVAEINGFLGKYATGTMTTPQFDSTKLGGGEVTLPKNKPFVVNLRVESIGEHGADIASVLSTFPDFEHETLFPPGTQYSVKGQPPALIDQNATEANVAIDLVVFGLDPIVQAAAVPTPQQERTARTANLFLPMGGTPRTKKVGAAAGGTSKEF